MTNSSVFNETRHVGQLEYGALADDVGFAWKGRRGAVDVGLSERYCRSLGLVVAAKVVNASPFPLVTALWTRISRNAGVVIVIDNVVSSHDQQGNLSNATSSTPLF